MDIQRVWMDKRKTALTSRTAFRGVLLADRVVVMGRGRAHRRDHRIRPAAAAPSRPPASELNDYADRIRDLQVRAAVWRWLTCASG